MQKERRHLLVVALALCFSVPALGQNLVEPHFPDGIPPGHPRIYWNPARLAQAQTWFSTHPFTPSTRTDPEAAEANPVDNAFKYLLTKDTSYCNLAKAYASAALDAIPLTGSTGCNECRWYGAATIIVYDWCYDTLTAAEKQHFYLLTDMLSYWNADDWGSAQPEFAESNFFWGYLENNLLWGIAAYGETPPTGYTDHSEEFIVNAMDLRWDGVAKPHFANESPHGVPAEGTDYGHYMLDYFKVPVITADLLGRDMMNETQYYSGAVFAFIYNTTQALTYSTPSSPTPYFSVFPYADSQDFVNDSPGTFFGPAQRDDVAEFMTVMATRYDGHDLARYARHWISVTEVGAPILYVRNTVAALDPSSNDEKAFSSLPLDFYAAGSAIAQAYARTGWGPNDTAVHMQLVSPPLVGHEHADTGNWQIWRKGRWLALEAPGRADSGFMVPGYGGDPNDVDVQTALGHNVLMFAGAGLASTGTGLAVLERVETNPNYFYAAADLTPAYHSPGSDTRYGNPAAGHEEREFIFVRPLSTLVILDRMQSIGSDTRKGFIVHAEAAFQPSGTNSYSVTNVDQVLRLTTVAPASPTYRTYDERSARLPIPFRIEVETTGTGTQYFLHVAQVRDATGQDLAITSVEDTGTFTLTLSHPTLGCAQIVLNKALISSGQSSGSFGYATTCSAIALSGLTTIVQAINITLEGPVWAGQTSTAPTITSTPLLRGTVGIPYVYDAYAWGVPAPTYSLSAPPSGMTIDANSGLIKWTPSAIGSPSVTVVASNGVLPNATQTFSIVVGATPPKPMPPTNLQCSVR